MPDEFMPDELMTDALDADLMDNLLDAPTPLAAPFVHIT